jgi:hypothetical protein
MPDVKRMRSHSFLTLILMLACAAAPAADDTFRCGSKIIDTSMTMEQITARCGEPTERSVEEIPQYTRRASGGTQVTGTVTVETWTYDRGSSSFPAVLRFEDGKLVSIEIVRP